MAAWAKMAGLQTLLEGIAEAKATLPSYDAEPTREGPPSSAPTDDPPIHRRTYFLGVPDASVFNPENLGTLESFHRCLTLYLWLSYRAGHIFVDQTQGSEMRREVEKAIQFVLNGMKFQRMERRGGSRRLGDTSREAGSAPWKRAS